MEFFIQGKDDIPSELNRLGLLGIGAEVGVLQGHFAEKLLSGWHGKRLYLVDAWRHFPGARDTNNAHEDGQLANFSQTFRRVHPFGERAVIVRDLSAMAAQLFPDHALDFVYIDAGHDYQNVMRDLEAWVPKVRIGGVVIGDDYTHGTWSHGAGGGPDTWTDFEVKPAVDEFVKAHGYRLGITNEDIPQWWFRKDR